MTTSWPLILPSSRLGRACPGRSPSAASRARLASISCTPATPAAAVGPSSTRWPVRKQQAAISWRAGGARVHDRRAERLDIVERTPGVCNERFVRPVLEDELARAHRYQRNVGVLLIEADGVGTPEEALKTMAAALAGTVRDVDTPGVLGRTPPQLLAILPDTDVAGTAHAANRVLSAVNEALKSTGGNAAVGLVCIRPGHPVRAGAVIESASRSLRSGRPEMTGERA